MSKNSTLNYRMSGAGHPVVFLHGFLESMSMWSYLDLESESIKAILIDLPGHGKSDLPEKFEDPSMKIMAEEVKILLDELGIEEYSIVGHSMGGYVALELKKIDKRCGKLVLLNSNFWEDPTQKKKDRVRVADMVLKSKDLFVQEAIPGLFYRHIKSDVEVVALTKEAKQMKGESIAFASLAMRNRIDNRKMLAANPEDYLIIHGEHDPLVSNEKLAEELNGLEVKVSYLNRSGHMAHIEEPEKVRELILDFIK